MRVSPVGPLTGLTILVLAFVAGSALAAPPAPERVLYRDATLIDPATATALPHMDVLVDGERITAVFSDSALATEKAKARVVDLSGRYLMPGLIDSHVHLATPPNQRQAQAVLRRDLYGGVTAVRDMADDLRPVGELTREALVGDIPAPDIYYAALMAGPAFFTDPRTAETSVGGVNGTLPWMQSVTPETDLPLAVARARGTNATAIKLYAALTPALAQRITAEAHRQGLKVWAHATLYPAKPSEVVVAGVDAVSHACLLVREPDATVPAFGQPRQPANLDRVRHGDNPALARLFATMKQRGTILDATLWTYAPPPPGAAQAADMPPLTPGSCDDVVGGAIAGQAFRAGVAISAGTDNIAPWTDPWPDLFHELDDLHTKADMPIAAVLSSATAVSAHAAGQDKEMGEIVPGKLANMIVLTANPLDDLGNLKSLILTIKRGRAYPRQDFVPLGKDDITDY
ncbi:amidohydrolase family protein [Asticcacaulis solisilvae]|uniref:amidohydrolase family protein n=1 Tax=Asticcacaulis solisilvae TaxID=1217274 RepID=UPI003FD8F3F9